MIDQKLAERCPFCEHPVSPEKFAAAQALQKERDKELLALTESALKLQAEVRKMERTLEEGPKRLGRPTKPPVAGERIQIGVQVSPDVKSQLGAVAERNHRSVSREAEFRIERSFDRQDLLGEVLSLAFGKELAGILMMLGYTMDAAGRHGDLFGRSYDWRHDHHAFGQAVAAAIALLSAAQPRPRQAKRKRNMPPFGLRMANEMIRAIRGRATDRGPFVSSDVDAIRSLLGPIAARIAKPEAKTRHKEPFDLEAHAHTRQSVAAAAADAVLGLINSSPRTPSREEIAGAIEKQFQSDRRAEGAMP